MIENVCELNECPECGSTNIICNQQRNQLICRDCGLIYEPMAPEKEEQFERVSGMRMVGRGIKKIIGRFRRRKRKTKKK